MEDRTTTPTSSAPLGDAPGAAPVTLPPSTSSGPRPRPTADILDTADTSPTGKDELGENVGPAPESGKALTDRTAEDIVGSEDDARNTAGLITSFVSSWERHKHEKSPAAWLADEFRRYPDLWLGEAEIVSTANEVVSDVERANVDAAGLEDRVDGLRETRVQTAHPERGSRPVPRAGRTVEQAMLAAGYKPGAARRRAVKWTEDGAPRLDSPRNYPQVRALPPELEISATVPPVRDVTLKSALAGDGPNRGEG